MNRRLTGQDFDDLRAGLATEAACLNPGCARVVAYRSARQGRQRLFCSSSCRLAYGRRRRRLLELLAILEWNAGYLELPVTIATLNQLVRQVTWELTRYGGVDEEALSELLPAEPVPPPSVAVRGLGRQPQHVEGDAEVDALEREYRAAVADFYDGRRRHYRQSQR